MRCAGLLLMQCKLKKKDWIIFIWFRIMSTNNKVSSNSELNQQNEKVKFHSVCSIFNVLHSELRTCVLQNNEKCPKLPQNGKTAITIAHDISITSICTHRAKHTRSRDVYFLENTIRHLQHKKQQQWGRQPNSSKRRVILKLPQHSARLLHYFSYTRHPKNVSDAFKHFLLQFT